MKRVAVVTGGTSGVGLQVIKDLLKEDYTVYSISRSSDKIKEAKEQVSEANFILGSVSDINFLDWVAKYLQEKEGKLDVLINSAGIIKAGGIEYVTYKAWKEMFQVNVDGVFLTTQALLPLLKKGSFASIVNVSSISSQIISSSIAYSACKAAVDMMTKSLAKGLSEYRIRVNGVNPGVLGTGFQVHNNLMDDREYSNFLFEAEDKYPLGVGTTEDVSNLICFLISKKASWITGSNYIIDGGRSVVI